MKYDDLPKDLVIVRLDNKKIKRLKEGVPMVIPMDRFPGAVQFVIAYGETMDEAAESVKGSTVMTLKAKPLDS